MAHDEGLYASRARLMFDSGDWIAPWEKPHHKTPGPYWLIASSYKLLGISDTSARLPSMIAGIFSLWLVYEIGKIMLGKKLAWLAAAILSVEFLWLQYCRCTDGSLGTFSDLVFNKNGITSEISLFLEFSSWFKFGFRLLSQKLYDFFANYSFIPLFNWGTSPSSSSY